MTADEIQAELEDIERAKQLLKCRAMVFQVDLKERLAETNGLPHTAYYDLSYEEWTELKAKRARRAHESES